MTRQELCAALDAQLAAAQEQVCVLAVPLAGGVPLYERGAGRRAVSASTIKVFILLAALDEVRRGRLALDTPVAVTAEDILPDTGVFVDGPGMHPLEELLVWMIVLSDNTATNVLIGLLGAECINAAACSVGTKNTVLERKMLDWDAVSAGRNKLYQRGGPAARVPCAVCRNSTHAGALRAGALDPAPSARYADAHPLHLAGRALCPQDGWPGPSEP